jgi:glycosyltransferase involved in cell wall biosynthesis
MRGAMRPFFTIITATYNAAPTLSRLLKSLAEQTCGDFQLILQDGASQDGTLAIAEAYRRRLPAFSLDSAPDKGLYDAWNKALPRACGEWILFLGADDRLADRKTLAVVRERMFSLAPEVRFAAGDLLLLSNGGRVRTLIEARPEGALAALPHRIPAPHPSLFHRRSLFLAEGFDASFRIAGDYEFLCRAWKKDAWARRLGCVVTCMDSGGFSNSPSHVFALRLETARAAARHFPREFLTARRIREVFFGACIAGLCGLLGPRRATILLNRVRIWRGLPPHWGYKPSA